MKNKKEDGLSELFLEKFVETLIMNSKKEQEVVENQNEFKEAKSFYLAPSTPEIIKVGTPEIIPSFSKAPQFPSGAITQEISEVNKNFFASQPIQETSISPIFTNRQNIKPIVLSAFKEVPSLQTQASAVDRLRTFLNDPRVTGIECPGPNKNVLVYKGGTLQTTSVIFSDEEINEILEYISEKTRIPLINGVFKAALTNILITAVISEFIGTRFHIEKKRTPFPPPVAPVFRR